MYDVENRRLIEHRLDGRGYLKLGPLRAPLDPPYFFAQEGMIDELAYLAKLDPWEFRKRNISDRRWLGVLEAAANAAKWTPRVSASKVSSARVVTGRGIAVGTHHLQPNQGDRITYAAAVVDVEVNKDNGRVIAKHVYGAMDCGLAINPGIVESQIVGMSVHGTSLALREEVAIQPDERDEPGLEFVSDTAFRRASGRDADRRAAAQREVDWRGRRGASRRRRSDRQRVLRCHRRETASVPADATSRPGRTQVRVR